MLFCSVPALLDLCVCRECVGLCGTQTKLLEQPATFPQVSPQGLRHIVVQPSGITWDLEAWDGKYMHIRIMRQKSSNHQSLLLYHLLSKIFFLFEENHSEIKAQDTAEVELEWCERTDNHYVLVKILNMEILISCSSQVIFLFAPGLEGK